MNNSYATEPFCQTARESARVSPPPGLTPYWDINRAEASDFFSFPSPRPRTDFQRMSSYQIPSSAISIPSNFIFFKSLCGGERHLPKATLNKSANHVWCLPLLYSNPFYYILFFFFIPLIHNYVLPCVALPSLKLARQALYFRFPPKHAPAQTLVHAGYMTPLSLCPVGG